MHKAFLSYQCSDKAFVEALARCLMNNGVDVFFDQWDILPGDSIPAELERGLRECDLFL